MDLNGYSNGGQNGYMAVGQNGQNGYGVVGQSQSQIAANLGLQWNPKHLEIKTRSVEKTLEPLVMQVRTF